MAPLMRNLKADVVRHLGTLATISKMLNSSYNVEELLGRVMNVVVETLGAERGFIILERDGRQEVCVAHSLRAESLDEEEFGYSRTVVDRVWHEGRSILCHDASHDERFVASRSLKVMNTRSIVCCPIRSQQRSMGLIYVDSLFAAGIFGESDRDLLEIICDLSAAALERAHYWQQTLVAEQREKQLYKEIIFAVTGGKLQLCDAAELALHLTGLELDATCQLLTTEEVPPVRAAAERIFADLPEERLSGFVLSILEAAANVIRHGGGGVARLGRTGSAAVACFDDQGPGIDPQTLPRATLMPGFSTKASMGMGYSLMLEACDRVRLHTSPAGTRLVLEMDLTPTDLVAEMAARLEAVQQPGHG